jgi:succinate dehydrogenase / fumarate reductase flavoprotein subunit
VDELNSYEKRYEQCSLDDTGSWTNQNIAFMRALGDMIILAKTIALGALKRDECRGAHYKPDFDIPGPTSDDPAEQRRQAEEWCQKFHERNERWLKSTITEHSPEGPRLSYEDVDTSLIPPRPRTYGLKGAEIIEEVWRERLRSARPAAKQAVGATRT